MLKKQDILDGEETTSMEYENATSLIPSFYAKLKYDDIGNLEGKILTIIDACISEQKQNKAMKDLIRRTIWFDWVENLDRTDKSIQNGMPIL